MRIGYTDGIESILTAIKLHINNDEVSYVGCGAIANIVRGNSKRKIIIK